MLQSRRARDYTEFRGNHNENVISVITHFSTAAAPDRRTVQRRSRCNFFPDCRSADRKSKRTHESPRSRIVRSAIAAIVEGVMSRPRDLAERCPRTRTDERPSDGQTLAAAIGYFHIIIIYTSSLHVRAALSAFSAHAAATAASIHRSA